MPIGAAIAPTVAPVAVAAIEVARVASASFASVPAEAPLTMAVPLPPAANLKEITPIAITPKIASPEIFENTNILFKPNMLATVTDFEKTTIYAELPRQAVFKEISLQLCTEETVKASTFITAEVILQTLKPEVFNKAKANAVVFDVTKPDAFREVRCKLSIQP